MIVSRHGAHRGPRNVGGGGTDGGAVDAGRRLTYSVARSSSFADNRVSGNGTGWHEGFSASRRHAAHATGRAVLDGSSSEDDEHHRVWGGGNMTKRRIGEMVSSGRAFSARRSSGGSVGGGREGGVGGAGGPRLSSSGPVGGSSNRISGSFAGVGRSSSSRLRAPGQHLLAAREGTWGALTRECRRDSVFSVSGPVEFRASGRRSSSGRGWSRDDVHRSSHRGEDLRGDSEAESGHGAGVQESSGFSGALAREDIPPSPGSSTLSGLSGWRRQRTQLHALSQRLSPRVANNSAQGEGKSGAWCPGEERGSPNDGVVAPGGETANPPEEPRQQSARIPADSEGKRPPRPRWSAALTTQQGTRQSQESDEGIGGGLPPRSSSRHSVASTRSWNRSQPAAAGETAGRPGTATGMRDLSALSHPTPAERLKERNAKTSASGGGGGASGGRGEAEKRRGCLAERIRSPRGRGPRSAPVSPRHAPLQVQPAAAESDSSASGASASRALATDGRAPGVGHRRDGDRKRESRNVAGSRPTRPTTGKAAAPQPAAAGAGDGRAGVSEEGASHVRPATRLQDALKGRGGGGGNGDRGRGGGGRGAVAREDAGGTRGTFFPPPSPPPYRDV